MNKSIALVGLTFLIYIAFIFFEFSGNRIASLCSKALIVPGVTLLYGFTVKPKTILFFMFLVLYTIANLLFFSIGMMPAELGDQLYIYVFYLSNIFIIIAYLFLLIEIFKSINFNDIIKKFKLQAIILFILNTYLVYMLHIIISPQMNLQIDYFIEIVYNAMVLLLLSISFLAYLNNDSKKRLYLFAGALSLVFTEVIDIAFYYVSTTSVLHFIAGTFTICAFLFFYEYSKSID